MRVDRSCGESLTIGLPFYSIDSSCNSLTIPQPRFTSWALRGSRTCVFGTTEFTTVTYTWDLTPIFE
jgi:hypothetical protein